MAERIKFDFGSPYHVDPDDDHPQNILVSVILSQAEDNYVLWKLDFLRALRIKNKVGFVDGTLEKPEPSSPFYGRWEQCNSLVMCWMWNSMTEALGKLVMASETAREMWEQLRRIFVPNPDLKLYQVRRKIATLRQDGDSVDKYFDRMRDAWRELSEYDPVAACACGGCKCETKKRAEEAREKEERYAFLMGLDKSLSFVRTHIMFMKPPPSLYQAYIMVKESESMMKTGR